MCVGMCEPKDRRWKKIHEGEGKWADKVLSWKPLCTPIYISCNAILFVVYLLLMNCQGRNNVLVAKRMSNKKPKSERKHGGLPVFEIAACWFSGDQ